MSTWARPRAGLERASSGPQPAGTGNLQRSQKAAVPSITSPPSQPARPRKSADRFTALHAGPPALNLGTQAEPRNQAGHEAGAQHERAPPPEVAFKMVQDARSDGVKAGPAPGVPDAGADLELEPYWVSGVDGSFPSVPRERRTRYYSVGRTRHFTGDLMDAGAARRAFEACSYNKEVILMCTDVGDIWFEFAFSQVLMLRERGYAHVMILMDNREDCEAFNRHMPDVCCVYSSAFGASKEVRDFWSSTGRLWTLRWLVFSKGLHLGYNVLHVDADIMVTQDMYRYLKHPIFMEYQLLALGDSSLFGINCGTVYGHNAHPAGPSSWAAFQVPDRTLRWLDDEAYILPRVNASNRFKLHDIGFEQSVFNDALWSTVAGVPLFAHSLRPQKDPEAMAAWLAVHEELGPKRSREAAVNVPADWAAITRHRFNNTATDVVLRYYDTQLVARGTAPNPNLGPHPFPAKRGSLSSAVMRFMADDGAELWPDWEAASVDPQVLEARREKLLLAPDWLMGSWNHAGVQGYWHVAQPHVVLAHFVSIEGYDQNGKKLGFKTAGWWHYDATQLLHGAKVFKSSTDAFPLPRLLLLDPSMLVKAASSDELLRMHYGLIVAGLMADRVWVWPPLDCSGKRARQSTQPHIWTGIKDPSILAYGGTSALKCLDLKLTWNYCMKKGLSFPDFREYSKRIDPALLAKTASNTLRVDGARVTVSADSAPDSSPVVAAPLPGLAAALALLEAQHVVYVESLFVPSEAGEPCVPNCAYEAAQPGLTKKLREFEDAVMGCRAFTGRLLPPAAALR